MELSLIAAVLELARSSMLVLKHVRASEDQCPLTTHYVDSHWKIG